MAAQYQKVRANKMLTIYKLSELITEKDLANLCLFKRHFEGRVDECFEVEVDLDIPNNAIKIINDWCLTNEIKTIKYVYKAEKPTKETKFDYEELKSLYDRWYYFEEAMPEDIFRILNLESKYLIAHKINEDEPYRFFVCTRRNISESKFIWSDLGGECPIIRFDAKWKYLGEP